MRMPERSSNKPSRFKTGYWHDSARPLAGLIFVAPMLLFYEIGVLLLDHQAIRNAADVWLRQILDMFGFGQYFLLPILTCGLLLAWHHMTRQPWRVNWSVFYGMLLESLVFGFLLVLIAGWQPFSAAISPCASSSEKAGDFWGLAVGYVGAGIYEELLFRLILLSAVLGLLRLCGLPRRPAVVTGVIVTSLLFSAAHYQFDVTFAGYQFATAFGDVFKWPSFFFRFLAGIFFSLLFLFRGFGVAVGSHAMYDLLTLMFWVAPGD